LPPDVGEVALERIFAGKSLPEPGARTAPGGRALEIAG
jgi:hypothetical protein